MPFLRRIGWLQPAVRRPVRPYLASSGRWNLARMPERSLIHWCVLLCCIAGHCGCQWVCSRSAEHVVSAATQIAANKNMRAAAAQSEASLMPAHCSHNHVHCNIFMNSWPLRCGPKGRNACMIAFTSGPNSQDFTLCKLACPVHAAESMTDGSLGLRASLGLALSPCMVCSLLGAVPPLCPSS